MYMRAIAAIQLHNALVAATAAGTEVDLQKYFISPGKREMKAVVGMVSTAVGSDSGTFDYKLQESATTVDSDFSDISGASITQVGDSDTFAIQSIHFFTKQRFVRGYVTLGATMGYNVVSTLFAVKRDA